MFKKNAIEHFLVGQGIVGRSVRVADFRFGEIISPFSHDTVNGDLYTAWSDILIEADLP